MLRINLLPVKAEAKRELGQRQLILFTLILVVALVGLYFFNQTLASDVEASEAEIKTLTEKIAELEASVKDREKYVARRRDLLAQKAIFIELHGRRSGPSKMLHELSMLVSPGRGPSAGWSISKEEYDAVLKDSPGMEVHLSWDPTRLWIERVAEEGKGLVIDGRAKSNDDVAELEKRLSLSRFFDAVELEAVETEEDKKTRERVVRFTINAVVNYSPISMDTAPPPSKGDDAAKSPKGDDGRKSPKRDKKDDDADTSAPKKGGK